MVVVTRRTAETIGFFLNNSFLAALTFTFISQNMHSKQYPEGKPIYDWSPDDEVRWVDFIIRGLSRRSHIQGEGGGGSDSLILMP